MQLSFITPVMQQQPCAYPAGGGEGCWQVCGAGGCASQPEHGILPAAVRGPCSDRALSHTSAAIPHVWPLGTCGSLPRVGVGCSCRQAQQLLGPNVKLPKAPDPLQSFLAAVGAPAMQPTEDSAPAPAEAPGAAMPAMGSMPNILAQAPAAANLLAANPVQNFISELLATPPAAQPELPAAETPAAAQTPAAASGMPDPLAALFAATTPVAQPTVTQPQPAAQTPAAAATPAAAGGVPQLLSALFATTPAAQPAARASPLLSTVQHSLKSICSFALHSMRCTSSWRRSCIGEGCSK